MQYPNYLPTNQHPTNPSQNLLQTFLAQLTHQLSDLQSLNISLILPKLQSTINTSMQPLIIQLLSTLLPHYSTSRSILKYAYILDKLIKLPVYNQLLQSHIVQFYYCIFLSLLTQKCYNQLDQLKILRKLWLKIIHPRCMQGIKQIIMIETGINVDEGFKLQAINIIKKHYQHKLKLNKEEMDYYLPKIVKMSNNIYESNKLTGNSSSKNISVNNTGLGNNNINMNTNVHQHHNENMNYIISQNHMKTPIQTNPPSVNPHINSNINAVNFNLPQYANPNRRSSSPINSQYEKHPYQYMNSSHSQSQPNIAKNYQYIHNMKVLDYFYYLQPKISPPRTYDPRVDPRIVDSIRIDQRVPMIDQRYSPENSEMGLYQHHQTNYQANINEKKDPNNGKGNLMINTENFKRERIYSQQTRSQMNYQHQPYPISYYEPEPQSRYPLPKKIHLNEPIPSMSYNYNNYQKKESNEKQRQKQAKYRQILSKLSNDRLLKCKQCGKSLKKMAEYENHMQEHFEEKTMNMKQKKNYVKI